MTNFLNQAGQMVKELRNRYGITNDKILQLMSIIPRHEFIPKKYAKDAYDDRPIEIGLGQTISQPYTVAYMTELLVERVPKMKKVLEIGIGSGYQSALLSKLFSQVFSIEIIPELGLKAKRNLHKLGYDNVEVKIGSGEWGWREKSKFDGIIVTAGIEGEIPTQLLKQLKSGGVLVAPVGPGEEKKMMRLTKGSGGVTKVEKFGKFKFVPFIVENN